MAPMLHDDTYSQIKARLDDWLESSGGAVADLSLDLINRAQFSLWKMQPWELLVKRAALTLSGKNAALPSDLGRIIDVYHDSDGDGRPDFHYYNKSVFADDGYFVNNSFTAASGHSVALAFYALPSNAPMLEYQARLNKFTGTGTEYSFFPGDLVLLEAQFIHITESGLVGNEYDAIVNRRRTELQEYTDANHLVNQDQRVVQNDYHGEPIEMMQYSLDGSTIGLQLDDKPPSYDRSN